MSRGGMLVGSGMVSTCIYLIPLTASILTFIIRIRGHYLCGIQFIWYDENTILYT